MKTLKYSRQRESIKTCLMNRHDHPTADAVYASIREEFPNISLGTVYRNLNRWLNWEKQESLLWEMARIILTEILPPTIIFSAVAAVESRIFLPFGAKTWKRKWFPMFWDR